MGWESADAFLARATEEREMPEEMPFNERSLRPGGLMRCCTGTKVMNRDPSRVGDILPCQHCKNAMIVAPDGVIEWNEDWRKRR